MRIGFNVSIDREAVERVRRARSALHGMLDKITDDPRHKAAKDRFELDAIRRVGGIGTIDDRLIAAAARAERKMNDERILDL